MIRRSSPQDISWFLDLRRGKQLDLNPPYQRRSVWNARDRRFFLDTVFRGYPCPPIFLHKSVGVSDQAIYSVVDGKQRLQTLFAFVDGEVSIAHDYGDDRFNDKTWDKLHQAEKQVFWDYVLPVEFLTFDAADPHEVNQAFDRLNRNMRKLDPQELRHARWDGWFIKLVEGEAEKPLWRQLGVVTNARSKRMKDAQFMSELLLVAIEGRQIGFDQDALDNAYARYDDLEELETPVDTVVISERVESSKNYLRDALDANAAVKTFAATFTSFYTLWVLVTLHQSDLPPAAKFADAYVGFMTAVRDAAENSSADPNVQQYAQAARGASTDLAPRTRRLEALRAYIAASV